MSDGPVWKRIDELTSKVQNHEVKLATLEKQIEFITDSMMRIEAAASAIAENTNRIADRMVILERDMSEAKGGIRFGKWLAGIAAAILGTAIAVAKWVSGA